MAVWAPSIKKSKDTGQFKELSCKKEGAGWVVSILMETQRGRSCSRVACFTSPEIKVRGNSPKFARKY